MAKVDVKVPDIGDFQDVPVLRPNPKTAVLTFLNLCSGEASKPRKYIVPRPNGFEFHLDAGRPPTTKILFVQDLPPNVMVPVMKAEY